MHVAHSDASLRLPSGCHELFLVLVSLSQTEREPEAHFLPTSASPPFEVPLFGLPRSPRLFYACISQ